LESNLQESQIFIWNQILIILIGIKSTRVSNFYLESNLHFNWNQNFNWNQIFELFNWNQIYILIGIKSTRISNFYLESNLHFNWNQNFIGIKSLNFLIGIKSTRISIGSLGGIYTDDNAKVNIHLPSQRNTSHGCLVLV
jgi:hypothetical protein